MSKEVKRLVFFLAKAVVIILLLDFVVGKALTFSYNRMKSGERARAHYAIERSDADLYVFGSSRALYHYDTRMLEDSLELKSYNAGRSAQTILYHLPVLKAILKRHIPKVVILDINENEFTYEATKYDLINSLLPYYPADEGMRQMIDMIKPGYKYFSWSSTLPYNSSAVAILYRSLRLGRERADVQGYMYVTGHRSQTLKKFQHCNDGVVIDENIVKAFREFVQLCNEKQIQLFTVTSPRFIRLDCSRPDLEAVKKEMAALHVVYMDFSTEKKYVDNIDYMYDEAHLNREGSIEFTKDIVARIGSTRTR